MKRFVSMLILITILCTCNAMAEEYHSNLQHLTTDELNQLQTDINNTLNLYHTPSYAQESNVLSTVREDVESFFSKVDISWPWADYVYTKDWDFYTLTTYISYEDESGKYMPSVYSEVYFENNEYDVYFLSVGKEIVIDRRNELPKNKWAETPESILNEASGIELSQMTINDINTLEAAVQTEFSNNHKVEYQTQDLLLHLTKAAVEEYLETDDTYVYWPWFDYDYNREWNLYTLTTRIDYSNVDDAIVYSEAYPISGQYVLCYLSIDGDVIIDNRDQLPKNLFEEADKSSNEVLNSTSISSNSINNPISSSSSAAIDNQIILENGCRGEDVKKLQLRLIELGYLEGEADGNYGKNTKAAVEDFQKESSLEVTGAITSIEMKMLFDSQTMQDNTEANGTSNNLTVENCELLAELLQAKEPNNLVEQFMEKYEGSIIEFDGNIAYMSLHENYKTRYDILIYYGDYNTTSVTGPSFQFRDVNYYDLHLTGENQPGYVCMGQNYHIIAKVVKYNATSELLMLDPISLELK